jgi:hypothetical protein
MQLTRVILALATLVATVVAAPTPTRMYTSLLSVRFAKNRVQRLRYSIVLELVPTTTLHTTKATSRVPAASELSAGM